MYQVFFHLRAEKQLQKLTKKDKLKISKKINKLAKNPKNKSLNIEPFYNTEKSWRIRAGNLRAIYTVNHTKKAIFIEYLGFRGSIYKNI
jgi:mRNA-degrading endonuclease RelE of RelBE toxin-antitoxin system